MVAPEVAVDFLEALPFDAHVRFSKAAMRKKRENPGLAKNVANGSTAHDARFASAVGERPSIEVRVLEIAANGRLQELSCYPLSYYGSCPNVGDTIVDATRGEPTFYSIQRRYFVTETILNAGWAIIVREIDPTGPPQALWHEWQDATAFWDDVGKQEADKLSRTIESEIHANIVRSRGSKAPPQPKTRKPRKRVLKPREP